MMPYMLPKQEKGEEPKEIFTVRHLISVMWFPIIVICVILSFSKTLSCGSNNLNLGGQENAIVHYNGGILRISIIENGIYWRIICKFSSKNVKINPANLHITNNGRLLDFDTVDIYGHKIGIPTEGTLNSDIIYFDVPRDNYKVGDKLELTINNGFIAGVDYAVWPITKP